MRIAQAEQPQSERNQAQGQPKGSGQQANRAIIVVAVMSRRTENQQQENRQGNA
jgi:hypothetical protein